MEGPVTVEELAAAVADHGAALRVTSGRVQMRGQDRLSAELRDLV
jgi:hypothetical protein